MQVFQNPLRGQGFDTRDTSRDVKEIIDTALPRAVFAAWGDFTDTPLIAAPSLAVASGAGAVHLKDETGRLGLGSFKVLGGAYAVARLIMAEAGLEGLAGATALHSKPARSVAARMTFLTASAGNHGIAVAAGARHFGAKARIFLNRSVPRSFITRLEGLGAEVDLSSPTYDHSLAAARRAAERGEGTLLSDTSWPGYMTLPVFIMQGYSILLEEAAAELQAPPTHIFLQAGVGGMAGALAAKARALWGDDVAIIVVEPERAACLLESIKARRPLIFDGPLSNMGRLDCKEPSLLALQLLARDADQFVTISDAEAAAAAAAAANMGHPTTPSGAAGIAALLGYAVSGARLTAESRALCILTEAAIA